MPYITREDGEHFVIPSYRDVITVKNATAAKREILLLSSNYGQYITLQPKGPIQYEIACSPDTGYLLGESVWYYFKRPLDMIYCEAIPNTTEAILVVVKDGSVYLDGSFPISDIPEELVIFLTQQNNFQIYVYGDVPISESPEEGKFSFEPSSVKSFNMLDAPIFATLPLYKPYQLQLVDQVLKAHGIGVIPFQKIAIGAVIAVLLIGMWIYMTSSRKAVQEIIIRQINPYQTYTDTLASPAPDQEMNAFLDKITLLLAMPGWIPIDIDYAHGVITASAISNGSNIQTLLNWGERNGLIVDVNPKGVTISTHFSLANRPYLNKIYPIKQVIVKFVDNLALVYPGNHLKFSGISKKGVYATAKLIVEVEKLSPQAIGLIGEACKGLPMVLDDVTLKVDAEGLLTGKITLEALGSIL